MLHLIQINSEKNLQFPNLKKKASDIIRYKKNWIVLQLANNCYHKITVTILSLY